MTVFEKRRFVREQLDHHQSLSMTDLQDRDVQRYLFELMLKKLESTGACRAAYHDLAYALFGDRLE